MPTHLQRSWTCCGRRAQCAVPTRPRPSCSSTPACRCEKPSETDSMSPETCRNGQERSWGQRPAARAACLQLSCRNRQKTCIGRWEREETDRNGRGRWLQAQRCPSSWSSSSKLVHARGRVRTLDFTLLCAQLVWPPLWGLSLNKLQGMWQATVACSSKKTAL